MTDDYGVYESLKKENWKKKFTCGSYTGSNPSAPNGA